MKAHDKYRHLRVEEDPLAINLSIARMAHHHRHIGRGHPHDHGMLPPPPNKPEWLPKRSAPKLPMEIHHHVAAARRMMPIKSRERS